MMSVFEYAEDINKEVSEVLKRCKELGIKVSNKDDLLDDLAITELDNSFSLSTDTESNDDNLEEIEVVVDNKVVNNDDIQTILKLKKKTDNKKQIINAKEKAKKDFANKKKEMYKNKEKLTSNVGNVDKNIVLYKENMTVSDFANEIGVSGGELVKKLFSLGIMATLNNSITYENAEILVLDYGKELKSAETANVANFEQLEIIDDENSLISRPPVVTIMGHVDHGKTTLLDTIKNSNVADKEAGGITQTINAYQVNSKGQLITFIDTPGHAAFTEMRARGAGITDIVIIIVAADDGVMPQTREAIDHARAAGVPILVAINKIDKPSANVEKVLQELAENNLAPEAWGGDTIVNNISAKTGEGIPELLESVLLVAEMQEYKANPNRYAVGTVIESRLDKSLGPVVNVLVQNGTLRLGDPIVVGHAVGKVRTLRNDRGIEITEALPSMPVEITGLNETPSSGDKFMAFESEKEARKIAEERKEQAKLLNNMPKQAVTLDDLFAQIQEGNKEIKIIIKADVNGSAEAVKNSLEKIEVEDVKINVIRSSVGSITESDIVLAKASNAILIGFNVRPTNTIKDKAIETGVEIKLYNIIYKVVEEIEAAMKGMLDPIFEEKTLGTAEVKQLFKFSKVGIIAGSYVTDGVLKRNNKVHVIRDGIVIFDGEIGTIQREKDTVKEIKKGLECGITIDKYTDIKVGDILEAYEMVEIKR